MSVLNENQLIGASASGEYEAGQSLRFDAGRQTYLTFQPSSASNRKTYTFSFWVKRSSQDNETPIFTSNQNHEPGFNIMFGGHLADDFELNVYDYTSGSANIHLRTTQKFRDSSAWYHIVVAVDTTQGTAANRAKIYVNGNQVTSFATETYPSQNLDTNMNNPAQTSGKTWSIGSATERAEYADGYLSDFNFIDGQALTPSSFGETGKYGEWKIKKYGGAYGTNGFFLPFEQDYSVEGFSTTIYEGTAASKYVGGAGFHPDLSWMKSRSHATNHEIQDSVRGNERLFPNTTGAASALRNGFVGFAPDGINLDGRGGGGEVNSNDRTKVVWNWDMGDNNPTGFSAVKYNGTSLVNKITGVGFSPDLIWTKARNQTYSNTLYDSVRGIDKAFRTNTTDAATDYGNMLETFDEDGFTIGDYSQINYANDYHIAWCWDMGDSTVSNTSGTIASQVRANTTYGQSIVTYTGSGSDATVGTGLSQTPDLIITKRVTSTTEWWIVYHSSVCTGDDNWFALNTTGALRSGGEGMYDVSGLTSTTFGVIGGASATNVSGAPQVSYCFHDVAGYSKFGSYSGSGSSGNAVTLGFRPSFLMIKRSDDAGEWVIVDSTRNPTNPANLILCANTTSKEADFGTTNRNIDLTSTGFTIQSTAAGGTTALNNSSGTYIYIAFAGGLDSIAPVNTSGNIESRVKANPTYGQSIVSYSGASNATTDNSNNGGSYWTIGHGLSQAPEVILVKTRNGAAAWYMGHQSLTGTPWQSGSHVVLNTTAANSNDANILWGNTAPSSTVFTVGGWNVINRANSTYIAYCFHSVTGYSKFGGYSGNGNSTGPTVTLGFSPAFVMIKRTDSSSSGGWNMWDNVRDTTNPNNTILEAQDSPSEVSNANYNINFTSTGFEVLGTYNGINNASGNYIYMAFADKREYAYWLDQSGNNNDWESNQELTESDVVLDSPSNNFCTFNPQDSENATNIPMRDGNLGFTLIANSRMRGTISSTSDSKFYIEYCSPVQIANTNVMHLGIATTNLDINTPSAFEGATGGAMVMTYFGGNDYWVAARQNGSNIGGSSINIPETKMAAGAIVSFASDSSTGKVWMAINNRWLKANGSFDATGNVLTSSNYLFQFATGHEFTPSTMPIGNFVGVLNCGQDSSFAGIKTPQGHMDSNEVGDFYYPPPAGFLALCTANLPSADVIPSKNFNTALYTGNGSTNAISVGFKPDLVWGKDRVGTDHHHLFDILRGTNQRLISNLNAAENTESNCLNSFDTNGFTLGSNTGLNANGEAHVAWNWKAGGTASSNSNGTITSSVSANPSAGFSIVSYTGTGSNATVGHGLSIAPELVIVKNRDDGSKNWNSYVKVLGNSYIDLNRSNGVYTGSTYFQNTAPSSTVFSIGTAGSSNEDDDKFIAYAFHSVDGYLKVGSYVGNGSADGTFAHCGFSPALIITKSIAATGWRMIDNKRTPFNPSKASLYPDGNNAEYNGTGHETDFTASGFKMRNTNARLNTSGQTYIFIAFAETPFKHSTAR